VLATDESTFSQFGWTYAGKKHEQVIKPFVDEINAQGGINGRNLVVKVRRYNPLSADERNAACIEVSEDMKAFAAIAPSGFWGDAEICMASKQTPLITNNNSSRDTNVRREKGWVHQTMMNKDRLMKTWVDWAISSRTATTATHNGLIYTDVPEDRQIVDEVLIPYMKQRHLQVTEVAALTYSGSPNPDLNQAEGQASVVKFRSSGVDLVWPVTNFLQMLAWAEQAEASQYKPKYVVSDFGLMATSGTTQAFPAGQWTGVTGITSYWGNEVMPGHLPNNAQFNACAALYKKHGLTIGQDPDDATKKDAMEIANMVHYCEHIALFAEVARRAGTNPTRRAFIAAFDGLGTWSKYVAVTESLSFKPGKLDGADHYAVIKWQPNCSSSGGCYRTTQGFRRSAW
jgi:ABC-type branched-subunit amino acid transport system substrate-binding protein